ncbi:hypothetical protein UA08_05592 [Talaromyces atroroseus]|uniref:Zn(2)-C6 fungal-type domain-containing protein n=1 Tax=Talaromyces atroroseus TaxID=1441469 RepID=A0A225AX63_TALAT|nr:hypothetical protein UA08_05592 [Talaromyces atroroseus]OKL59035.1 hypothetical protein UA08_05592 [Talaromyces atroroseus]
MSLNDQKDALNPTTDDPQSQRQQKSRKSYHKKSKTGCGTCRSRRVKCDEVHPICGNCVRYGVECFYDRFKPGYQYRHNTSSSSSPTPSNVATSRSPRHLLELQLMSQFITKTVDSLPTSTQPELAKVWREDAPRLAMKHPALLDTIFALASLHLTLTQPSSNCSDAHCQYMDSVLKAHREEIRNVTLSNADAVWFTSSLLRFTIFARLQERNIEPYTLPGEWLSLMSMAGSTFRSIWTCVRENPGSEKLVTMELFRASILAQEWHKQPDDVSPRAFAHLLERAMPRDELEPWGSEISETYAQAVEALGNIKYAIDSKQATKYVTMRLAAYLGLLPPKFGQLVLDKQPRALVIFAHYFTLMADYTDVWTIGATPQREITGLSSLIPEDWQPLMHWPLSVRDSIRSASNMEAINDLSQFTI